MSKLDWCKEHAPAALKSVSDAELLSDMSGAFDNYVLSMLPSKDLLEEASFTTSLGRSTNKLKITDEILDIVLHDALTYFSMVPTELYKLSCDVRVKTTQSIINKVARRSTVSFQSVFNDILGLRFVVPDYPNVYPDYFRVVDMRNGKSVDDGYRGVHLYYKRDNNSYVIEIQLWSEFDNVFNRWSHSDGYKMFASKKLAHLHDMYVNGTLTSYSEFRKELHQ